MLPGSWGFQGPTLAPRLLSSGLHTSSLQGGALPGLLSPSGGKAPWAELCPSSQTWPACPGSLCPVADAYSPRLATRPKLCLTRELSSAGATRGGPCRSPACLARQCFSQDLALGSEYCFLPSAKVTATGTPAESLRYPGRGDTSFGCFCASFQVREQEPLSPPPPVCPSQGWFTGKEGQGTLGEEDNEGQSKTGGDIRWWESRESLLDLRPVAVPAQVWHLWGSQLRGKLDGVVIGVWGTKEAAGGWVLGRAVR